MITEKELQSVLTLDGPARYGHFIKRVVDAERAWGLWQDGWAIMHTEQELAVFPLWPAKEYASLFRSGSWADYEVREISLDALLEDLLPALAEKGVLPGVFPTPTGKGITPNIDEFRAALLNEQKRYGDEEPHD